MKSIFKINDNLDNELKINCEWKDNLGELTLTNNSKKNVKVAEIILFVADMPFAPDTKVYGEGFNMLSQYGGTVSSCNPITPYSDFGHYKLKKPENMNQVYNMALFSPADEDHLIIGYASCYRFNGWIRFNEHVLQIGLNCENITVAANETIVLEQIYIERGKRNDILNNLADAIGKNHPQLPFPEIPTGWCSWPVFGPFVTSKNIYDNLNEIKKRNLDFKYIQIDDGYQAKWGDWFDFSDQFEVGVDKICQDINKQGFEPAIWVAPFVAEPTSKILAEHPDWFVQDDYGKPLASNTVTFGGWRCAPWSILDTTNPEVLDHIKNVFKKMHDEWCVRYFKLDAIVWASFPYGHRQDKTKTGVEAYRMGMQAIIDAVGDDSFILVANSPMWPSIGVVHGMRVTCDVNRTWGRFKQIAKECFFRNWQHNKLWINDPDTVLFLNRKRTGQMGPDGMIFEDDGSISQAEFLFNAAYVMASGGMVLGGDDVPHMNDKTIELTNKLLPPTNVPAEFDDDTFTVGRAKISDDKTIIYVFNFDDEAKDISVKFDGCFDITDLFEDKHIGTFKNEINFKDLAPHDAKVLICKRTK